MCNGGHNLEHTVDTPCKHDLSTLYTGADPGGGAKGALPPPPIFWGKNKGAKNHTHRRKKDQNRTTTKLDTG